MTLQEDGSFGGTDNVTKGAFCEALYGLLDGLPRGRATFKDLKSSDEHYTAIASLYTAGLLTEEAGSDFGPDLPIDRQEAAQILKRVGLSLSGPARDRAVSLSVHVAAGDTDLYAAAGEGISRGELAMILEELAGRTPDETALFLRGLLPADVDRDAPYWAYIADAVTEGPVEPMEPGVHRAYGSLYAVWEDGTLVVDADYGVWTFGLDGRYTTGDEELDGYLEAALEDSGANDLEDDEEALEAAFLYIKYDFEYLVRPEDMETEEYGSYGWEYERALRFFKYGGGTCYGFAAAFGLMARMLGQTAYIISAEVNQYYAPHGFVVIPEDGVDWIYDVELEATRQERHADLELFHMRNHAIYNYWYTADW